MTLLRTLRDLQSVDEEWDTKGQIYQSIKQKLVDHTVQEARRDAQKAQEERLSHLKGRLRDAEMQLASLSEKNKRVDKELYNGSVVSPRELENLRQESKNLKESISRLEDEMLDLMSTIDRLQVSVDSGQVELEALEKAWEREHVEQVSQYRTLRSRLEELQARRKKLRSALDQGALALYDELRRSKNGQPLAPLQGGVCQACRVSIPSSKATRVLTEKTIELCDGCGRILYQA